MSDGGRRSIGGDPRSGKGRRSTSELRTDRIKSAFRLCREEGEILGKAVDFEGGINIAPLWRSGGLSAYSTVP